MEIPNVSKQFESAPNNMHMLSWLPRRASTDWTVNVNLFHAIYAHRNDVLLKETAKFLNVVLTGETSLAMNAPWRRDYAIPSQAR